MTPETVAEMILKACGSSSLARYMPESKKRILEAAQDVIDSIKRQTGLKDRTGKEILVGQVVHWPDGGEDLSLEYRVKERWDRIAVVQKNPDISFKIIDSPNDDVRKGCNEFNFGCFIYRDTERFLTVVAESVHDYHERFSSAGDCMAWVLERNKT